MKDCKKRIVHLCISQSYFDNWGYQENLIPEYQADLGHQVTVISTNKFYPHWLDKASEDAILSKGARYCIGNVKIIRLKVFRLFGTHIVFTYNLYKTLMEVKPDIIFYHEMTNFSIIICAIYKLIHPKTVYFIDSHTDKRNSASTKISELFYFKFFLTIIHKVVALFVKNYYGVTPSRCRFLLSHYGISKKKMKFLPIGCDTKLAEKLLGKNELRKKYNIPLDTFIIISGGKMGKFKGTEYLVEAVDKIVKKETNTKLILFGSYLEKETEELVNAKEWIIKFGWCERIKSLELLKLADIAVWPIHHTTLNEDSISVGTPLVIRKTSTTEHLIENNGIFLHNVGDVDEMICKITEIKGNIEYYKKGALVLAQKLSYKTIAETIIEDTLCDN